jgi:CBS domain containing-hemolysin-like protein
VSAAGGVPAWLSALTLVVAVPATVLVVLLSALIERSGPIRLRHWADEAEGRLLALHGQPARFEAFRFLVAGLAKLLPAVLVLDVVFLLPALGLAGSASSAVMEAFGLTALVLVAAEVVNRLLVGLDPEWALEWLTPAYRPLAVLLAPLVVLLAPLVPAGGWERRTEDDDEDEVSDEEIQAYLEVGTREGIMDADEEALVKGIFDFSDTSVRSVMTPRMDLEAAPVDSTLRELADRFLASGHSRLPLYEESVDHVVGVLHMRDVLGAFVSAERPRPSPRELAHAPFFVPETKPLYQLLKELQERRQQIAIVVDEYGGTAGLVTAEDLVEEIVGELVDEHEEEDPDRQLLADGAWLLDGSLPVYLLDELFGVDLTDEPYETLGGLIFGHLGDLPAVGETVELEGLVLTVEELAERRVARARVEAVSPTSTGETEEAAPDEAAVGELVSEIGHRVIDDRRTEPTGREDE